MKIFFLMKKSGYLRNYASVVRLLSARGHQIQLGFLKIDGIFPQSAIEDEIKDLAGVSYFIAPKRTWFWKKPAEFIRVLQTYLRYLDPHYIDAHKLRSRAAAMLPRAVSWLACILLGRKHHRIWTAVKLLRRIESCIPPDPALLKFFTAERPDVFLVTPLIDLRVSQLDWLKCALALGIKTGLCVASWDNLSNKSLIQLEPDAVYVWNDIQRREAIELHHIPPARIVVTGAQCYDRLFARRPSTSAAEFRQKVGLPPDGRYLLYLCSSGFIAPREVEFVIQWIESLRKSADPLLNKIGVLVRPHPQNADQWHAVDFSGQESVALYPRRGANPIGGSSLNDFFDSMYHSSATIGINTSPMIESGILNKPVLTVLTPEFRDTQNGTLHFRHLVDGGLLSVGHGLAEHLEQLRRVLADREFYETRINNFIQGFVRPHGRNAECTPIFADAVETLVSSSASPPASPPPWRFLVWSALLPWAAVSYAVRKFKYCLPKKSM